ncbi:MAG: hypothetical protein IH608_06350 [Proteobacteria bacterium]|nr:hypothetical protein [Pseudomonadota bacterium]
MRSAEERLERLVCGEHCRFFKPWHGESRRCGGHAWLQHRACTQTATLDALEKLRGAKPTLPLRTDALLLRTVCTRCDYYPYHCRYRSPTGPANADPCGGVVVLDLLLDRALVAAEDLYDPPGLHEASGI